MTQYNDINTLSTRLKNLEERMAVAEGAPRLSYSSIQDGGITEYDANGNPVARYGKQWDGTHTAASLSGPKPPPPTGLSVRPVVGGLEVIWDGTFEGLVPIPMDYARTEIHIAIANDFEISPNSLQGTFESPQGGVQFFALSSDTEYFTRLATRSQSGKISEPTPDVAGTPLPAAGDVVIPIPDEPIITSVTGTWEYDTSYTPRATFTVNFSGVNVDTTGAALTPVGYELWMKKTSDPDSSWLFITTTTLASFKVVNLSLSTSYSFKVRALTALAAGDFSNVVAQTYASASVVESVPTPATPSSSSTLSIFQVGYNGLTSTGTAIPPHVARVDVYISPDAVNYVKVGDILQTRVLPIDSFPVGSVIYAKLKAVSTYGTEGSFSGVTSATILGVVTGDLANLSITAGKLAANAVTAGKILAGAIDGMIITGSVIRTAASGQRVHIDTSGLKGYNNLDQVVTQISATDGKLTAVGGSFSGAITATSGAISGPLSISGGQITAINPDEPSYTLVVDNYGLSYTAPSGGGGTKIATRVGVPGITTERITMTMGENVAVQTGNKTYVTDATNIQQTTSTPSDSNHPYKMGTEITLGTANKPTVMGYFNKYTAGDFVTVSYSGKYELNHTGLVFSKTGVGAADPQIKSDGSLAVSANGLSFNSGIQSSSFVKNASNTGNVVVQGTLAVEGISQFTGAITAPGGIGGLPTPVADSAAATKAYVDSIGSNFSVIRLSSTVTPTASSTGHAFQAGPSGGSNVVIGADRIVSRTAGTLVPVVFPSGITGLPAPTTPNDAASKDYVDTRFPDTGWIASTYGSGVGSNWNVYVGYSGVVSCRKIGEVVYMRGFMARTPATGMAANELMAVIPSGYGFRPSAEMHFAADASNAFASFGIQANGNIVWKAGSGSWYSFDGVVYVPVGGGA